MSISPITANIANAPSFKAAPKVNPSLISKTNAAVTQTKVLIDKGKENLLEYGLIKPVLQPIVNSKFMGSLIDKSSNIDRLPCHMSTAGSFVTTATYANRTLKTMNRTDEEKKRAKVLALNQVMVTGVSTLGAYTFNKQLDKFSKNLGYKFREANQGNANLSKRMKGFNIAKQLLIFSIMYRYVAPVIVTPVASKIGKFVEHRKERKAAEAAALQNATVANNVNVVNNNTVATK
ncbi:MAG: hypothetical protein NC200_04620 [Candidatus Gastranaerophilales bacterium]|nr:hypothetical protein [Candidatus Gastranaerophilales bacterium]